MDQFETSAYDARPSEEPPYCTGPSVCRDIKVLGPFAKKKVPDCASDDVRFVPIVYQLSDYVNGIGVNCVECDTMFSAGVDLRSSD